mgnify:CR=1 FL=1
MSFCFYSYILSLPKRQRYGRNTTMAHQRQGLRRGHHAARETPAQLYAGAALLALNPEIRRRQTGVRASQTPQRQIRGGKSDQANRPAVDVDKRLQTESGEIRNTDSIHHCAGQG